MSDVRHRSNKLAPAWRKCTGDNKGKKVKINVQLFMGNTMSQLRSVTCHMGSHSVTCYPTQVNIPRLRPSQTGRYSIYLPRRDGRL